uniref:GRIP domain-containing protein n=1 Tax=Angiostrongylus cantonensis TaxID=6313 RepID=A0A158P7K2_ANGCA
MDKVCNVDLSETTEPGLQNRFDTEPDSISRRLTTDELLVSKEKELEMTIVAKLELEARVLTLERDLSGWEERLEEATKVAAIESKNSLTTIQQLHEILEKQEAQLTELRLQLGEKEAIEGKEHDQEKVIAQLRAEIDDLQHQQEVTTSSYEEKLRFAEDEIMVLKACEENATKSLAEMQEKFGVIEEKLHIVEKSREDEKLEGDRIRFEYEKALENLNCELESETAIRDLKLKAEKKLGKIKAATENDVTLAKAELALKIDELQRVLSERNCLIDKMVVEKARMEQKFIEQQEENELKYRQAKEVEKQNVEIRVAELENENRLLGEENSELVKYKEESNARIEESERNVKELQDKIRFLLDTNENSSQKAVEKHDNENRKAFRELQKEIRQLYMELDVKTEALDTANARLFELESNSSKVAEEAIVPKHNHRSIDASPNHEIDEELELMRRKLNDSHKEVDELRETNSKLENLLKEQWKNYQNSPAVIKVSDSELHEGLGFSDPAEAETLARVIGTVAKFSKSEMENVISREESRVAGWVGGTVSHVLTGR